MMWLPQQTVADWQESVEALIEVGPEHASLYLLELYPNAPLKEDMARGGWSLAPDDDAAEMYLWSLERLEAAGYRQYEISNVARPGARVAPQPQVLAGRRVARVRLRRAFDPRRRAVEERRRRPEDYIARVRGGADAGGRAPRAVAARAGGGGAVHRPAACRGRGRGGRRRALRQDTWGRFGPALQPFVTQGIVRRDGDRLRLTREGMLIANEVMAVFV